MSKIDDFFLVDLKHNKDLSNDTKGDIQTISGRDNLKQAIYNRLMTVKGTIVHRPDYGIGVKLYQGKLSTIENQRKLALEMRAQFAEESRIESFEGVKFKLKDNESSGEFIVTVRIIAAGIGEIEETFNPFGE